MVRNIIVIFTLEKISNMKKNIVHFYILVTVLFSDYLMFAQEPGDTADPAEEPLEGEDAPAAPINGKLILLAITGILFAYYIYKRERRAA